MLIKSKYHNAHVYRSHHYSNAIHRRRKQSALFFFSACLMFMYYLRTGQSSTTLVDSPRVDSAPNCPQSSIKNDILVVLRTGATEVPQKLPVHFKTTLRCIQNYVIFSDYEEDIEGHHIHDVFNETSDALKDTLPEFQLYKHLQAHGRDGLNTQAHLGSGPTGSLENPGWKLDKFKFLPMVEKALRYQPDAEWFVFVEPDTYLAWANLLEYLSHFDADKPFYIGKHMYIDNILFAHGGSGFALSKAAIKRVSQHWKAHVDDYLQYTIQQWAGDMVLGRVLRDVDIDLFWAFPNFQGDPVSSLDHNITKIGRQPWCFAPVTYHHMQPDEITKLWEFEQRWGRENDRTMRHSDVFRGLILPQLSERLDDWDNLSMGTEYSARALAQLSAGDQQLLLPAEREAYKSFEDCNAACSNKTDCMQFSYSAGRCFTSTEVRQGFKASSKCLEYSNAAGKCVQSSTSSASQKAGVESRDPVQSGWMMKKMERYMQRLTEMCDGNSEGLWVT